jgi:hypothetical protein
MSAGFNWDGEEYTETAGSGAFISKEAFNKLIYTDAVVFITGIREGISTYNGDNKPQWLVDFVGPDGEEYTKGLGKGNAERDARMIRLQATLNANPGEPIEATPFYVGQRIEFGKPKVTA